MFHFQGNKLNNCRIKWSIKSESVMWAGPSPCFSAIKGTKVLRDSFSEVVGANAFMSQLTYGDHIGFA